MYLNLTIISISIHFLDHIHDKKLRQIFEASAILLLSSVKTRPGFFNLFPFLGKLILNNYNI